MYWKGRWCKNISTMLQCYCLTLGAHKGFIFDSKMIERDPQFADMDAFAYIEARMVL